MFVIRLFDTLATVLQMKDTGKGKKRVELLPRLNNEEKRTSKIPPKSGEGTDTTYCACV